MDEQNETELELNLPEEIEQTDAVVDVDPEQEVVTANYEITSYGADYPVDGLVKRLENKDIVIPSFDPAFDGSDDVQGFVRRLETDELSVVDFKSTARSQAEDLTTDQLHVYAVGYEELTGDRPDLIGVLNLDAEGKSTREQVIVPLLAGVRDRIRLAGDSLRVNDLPKHKTWCGQCDRCDFVALCRDRPKATQSEARGNDR